MPHSSNGRLFVEPVRVDSRGRLWWSSLDPAVREERVRVIDRPEGGRIVRRIVIPAPGFLPEDIQVDPADEAVLVVPREARRRAEVAAMVHALRSLARRTSVGTAMEAGEIGPGRALTMPSARPLTSWGDVAAAIGISEDTLARRRRRWNVGRGRPNFDDVEAARVWYRRLECPPPVVEPPVRRAPPAPATRASSGASQGLTLAELRARSARGPR